MKKTAIVTGSSRGIGFAIARQLGLDGYNIVMVATGPQEKNQAAVDALQKQGVCCAYVQANIGDHDDRLRILDAALTAFGRVDALVNNAGVTRDGLMVTMKDADYDMVLDINLKGAFHMIRACYRDFMRKKSGKIINISSIAGLVGNVGQVNYAASKAGLIGMSKSVAKELGSRGVCCNCIAPGFIETAMTKDIKEDNPLLAQVPMRKMGTPEDVANLALFLASPESDYITGETIRVDGGLAI